MLKKRGNITVTWVSQPKEQREKTEMIAFLIQGSGVRVVCDLRLSGYMDSTLSQQ